MKSIEQQIQVGFRYTVHFTTDVFARSNPLLRDVLAQDAPAKVLFVVDRGVEIHHDGLSEEIESYCLHFKDALEVAGPALIIPGGEEAKNHPRHLEAVQLAIHEAGLCRHSYLVAIGGGAALDVAGYAAATAHRGVRMIRIPTTVLAQGDSGVGVKNGINAFGKKNYLGTFAPPFAVINDFGFLRTLSDRDWRSGIAEAVKVALIKDAGFFSLLEERAGALGGRDARSMEEMIERCATLHLAHIASSGDPFELGASRPLDFGHWAAHKLEQLTDHRLRHGEAVAIGIALDSTYSYLCGFLAEKDWRRITDLLLALGFAVYTPELNGGIFPGLDEFREHLGGRLTIMLLRSIGDGFEVHEIDREIVIRSIGILKTIDEQEGAHVPVGRNRIG